ncbi:MAG TPA: aldehyde dehydrogenase (NADP(+)) [Verrucomicrobiae bacterium]|nr:aldehyde dehydrogenase (NADP(+)) [Verrucomicrobiae bacterium]
MTTELLGKSIIGYGRSEASAGLLYGNSATTGERLQPAYHSATNEETARAAEMAGAAFPAYRAKPARERAAFLRKIAENLEGLGDRLVERVVTETALPEARVKGERARTCGQLRFFADMIEEGSWVDARIDRADSERKPAPKPDIRSMLRPLGPVAVFCASNFPLAFSVAGGDTATALACGCPVVVKAHMSHPATAELCGEALMAAAQSTGMPEGVFSLLFGEGTRIGQALVAHPAIKAAGFTGSRTGGLALVKTAQSRPDPIPVYAEMSSVNPVFVLPNALAQRGAQIAAGLHGSVTLGVGQFCTNPGLVLVPEGGAGDGLASALAEKLRGTAPASMLNATIFKSYSKIVTTRSGDARVRALVAASNGERTASAALFETDAPTFLKNPDLAEEMFGPATILIRYGKFEDTLDMVRHMEGNLTATIQMAAGDEDAAAKLVAALETRVGRIVFNGYPTGVEVCQAMVHGGPYPATPDGRTTSVGGRAIERWVRAVCWQDSPVELLPEELRDDNPRGVMRIVDGVRGR